MIDVCGMVQRVESGRQKNHVEVWTKHTRQNSGIRNETNTAQTTRAMHKFIASSLSS